MDLQLLFKESILEIKELSPGYDNHASDVWLVKTNQDEVIVRSSRSVDDDIDGPFWASCKKLFGINPRRVHAIEEINNTLNGLSCIPIPKVIGKGFIDREYVIVEKLIGTTLKTFKKQPKELLLQLGRGLAQIHQQKKSYIGNPGGTWQVDLKDFHQHLIKSMTELVDEFYLNNHKFVNQLPKMIDILKTLPVPPYSTYVLVDMDPTQFMIDESKITGLVDTEAYVIAPREIELIALEYVLDQESANDFKEGYRSIMELPDLTSYRLPYRYLLRLIEIQGKEDLDQWLNYPILL